MKFLRQIFRAGTAPSTQTTRLAGPAPLAQSVRFAAAVLLTATALAATTSAAFAEGLRVELSPRALDSSLTTKLAGETYHNHNKGTLYSLGLTAPITEHTSLHISAGQAQHGQSQTRKYQDRVVKFAPRLDLYRFSPVEALYGSAGVSLHHFERAGKNFEAYGVLAGIGLKHESPHGLGFTLDVSYENSLFVQSYRIEGMTAKNRYSALEFGIALTYGL